MSDRIHLVSLRSKSPTQISEYLSARPPCCPVFNFKLCLAASISLPLQVPFHFSYLRGAFYCQSPFRSRDAIDFPGENFWFSHSPRLPFLSPSTAHNSFASNKLSFVIAFSHKRTPRYIGYRCPQSCALHFVFVAIFKQSLLNRL